MTDVNHYVCMEELSPTPEITFELPSRLRIQQRLGQVTTNATVRESLTRGIGSHAHETLTAEQFVEMVAGHMQASAEEHAMGIDVLLLKRMPSVINTLLDKESDKRRALRYWEDKIEAEKGLHGVIEQAAANGRPSSRPRTYRSQQQSARAAGFRKPSLPKRHWQS